MGGKFETPTSNNRSMKKKKNSRCLCIEGLGALGDGEKA
jgi:hypothetical protein